MPTALPPRSPLAALIAEQHAREQLIAAMVAGEHVALRQFIRADWRCWRAGRRWKRSLRGARC